MTTTNLTLKTPSPAGLVWQVTANEAAKSEAEREAILADPGFGNHFTDHMADICWSERGGWHRPRVSPYGRSSSTRPPPCCTTRRRSSRA